jgi:hypothetical protein
MRRFSLIKEAAICREMAREFSGYPEAPFLLRIATEFEELALTSIVRRRR